jgi:hypothetical protein
MKSRLLAAMAAAVGIAFASSAPAGPLACSNYATVAAWAAAGSCIDQDNDLLVTFVSAAGLFPVNAGFSVTEVEIGGVDIYDIGFAFGANGWAGGGSIQYRVSSLNAEAMNGANLDTITAGSGAKVTKTLLDVGAASPFLTLVSIDGSRDPAQGETPFASRFQFVVVDTFDASGTALYYHSDNSLRAVAIPEPATVGLLALGLAGLVALRRRMPA